MYKSAQFLLNLLTKMGVQPWPGEEIVMHQAPSSCSIPTKILQSLDFRSSSYAVLELAANIRRHFHAELYRLNIVPMLSIVPVTGFLPEKPFFQAARHHALALSATC